MSHAKENKSIVSKLVSIITSSLFLNITFLMFAILVGIKVFS